MLPHKLAHQSNGDDTFEPHKDELHTSKFVL